MKKLKVLTVIGTRPEIIKLSATISNLDATNAIEHILVHTGQNYDYELNEIFFKDLDLRKPDHFLNVAGNNAAETIANTLMNIDPVLATESPDAILVLGDTNSSLCVIAAKKRKIPIFHMEAGNRSFDQRVPEETNRKIVDCVSDINLVYSQIAREYLIRENCPADRIINIGCPMFEVLAKHRDKYEKSGIVGELSLNKNKYFLVSSHREENIDNSQMFEALVHILNTIASKYKLPIIVSCHPRTSLKFQKNKVNLNALIKLKKPFGFVDYINLQQNAAVVLSDSGTISEESSILNFPAINLRQSHERPEATEEASVVMTGFNCERVLQAISLLLGDKQSQENLQIVRDYNVPNVADKVVRTILSYTDYVNRNVWKVK